MVDAIFYLPNTIQRSEVKYIIPSNESDMTTTKTSNLIQNTITQFNQTLISKTPSPTENPIHLHKAMHYALFNGGKRIRPLLVYFTGQVFNTPMAHLHNAACAVELIHAYSLAHDDLPAMDDDDYRRGKPACHKAYDEATAILVGDALQAHAFELLSTPSPSQISPDKKLNMINQLSTAVGSQGMVGGQLLDLLSEGKTLSVDMLSQLHQWKTGALIQASVELGMLASEKVSEAAAKNLRQFASCLGLAFQIRDDIKDIEGNLETLGKIPGGDLEKQKATYPAIVGLDKAKDSLIELIKKAQGYLQPFNDKAKGLCALLKILS